MFYIWHSTIWSWGSSIAGALENAKYPFIAFSARVLFKGEIELYHGFEFNFFDLKLWFELFKIEQFSDLTLCIALSAGAVQYTDSTFADRLDVLNECPRYDTKQSDDEVPVLLELRGIQGTPSLPFLQGPLKSELVAPDWAQCIG